MELDAKKLKNKKTLEKIEDACVNYMVRSHFYIDRCNPDCICDIYTHMLEATGEVFVNELLASKCITTDDGKNVALGDLPEVTELLCGEYEYLYERFEKQKDVFGAIVSELESIVYQLSYYKFKTVTSEGDVKVEAEYRFNKVWFHLLNFVKNNVLFINFTRGELQGTVLSWFNICRLNASTDLYSEFTDVMRDAAAVECLISEVDGMMYSKQ